MKSVTCPHCERELTPGMLEKHVRSCPENPALQDAIRAALADPDRPGIARSQEAYRVASAQHGAPQADALVMHFGHWRTACHAYGLKTVREAARTARPSRAVAMPVMCPHCKREYAGGGFAQHIKHCAADPALRPHILAALADPDAPGFARGDAAYSTSRLHTPAPSAEALRDMFGEWPAVCEAFGLLDNSLEARQERAMRETAEEYAEAQRIMEAARERAYGLPVCRVREVVRGGRVYEVCELR